jgi:CubicO group peptidase (beta-lactamase class C family)
MSALTTLADDLKRGIRRHRVPGATVAVMRGRRLLGVAAAGVTNVDTRVPVTTDTVFQIGSITKVFTTTLVMQLVDDRLLDLDRPVADYLPEFRVADAATRREVTARHLLSHTSGIDGDFFPNSGRGDDAIARFVDMCTMLPSLFPLGTKMSYCNVGFAVLGRVIEVLRRETWDDAMRRRIFRPLGMKHAMTLPEDALRHRCAVGHVPDPKDPTRMRVAPLTYLSFGQKAAGSTPAMSSVDLLEFAALHMHGGRARDGSRVLSAASVAAMQRRQVRLQKHSPRGINAWGLGWSLCNWPRTRVIGHDGGTIGQYSFLRLAPERKLAVVLLTNGGDAMSLYDDVVGGLFESLEHTREPALPTPDDALHIEASLYEGRYENIAVAYTIESRRGVLVVSAAPKTEGGGISLTRAPLAFVDQATAVLHTGNPQMDRTSFLFSDADANGRFGYVQMGLRQFRRVEG